MGISTAYIVLAVGLLIKNNKAKYVIKDKTKHVQLISIENAKSQWKGKAGTCAEKLHQCPSSDSSEPQLHPVH